MTRRVRAPVPRAPEQELCMRKVLSYPSSGADNSASLNPPVVSPPVVNPTGMYLSGIGLQSLHGGCELKGTTVVAQAPKPRRQRRQLPPVRTSQRLHSGPWQAVSRMPRVLRRETRAGEPTQEAAILARPSSEPGGSWPEVLEESSGTFVALAPHRLSQPGSRNSRSHAPTPSLERQSLETLAPLVHGALNLSLEPTGQPGARAHARTQRSSPEPLQCPLPHIPEGLCQEHEGSVRSLATMVVAYHETVPLALQEEFIRQVMKFAGEKAGQLIRSSWEAP